MLKFMRHFSLPCSQQGRVSLLSLASRQRVRPSLTSILRFPRRKRSSAFVTSISTHAVLQAATATLSNPTSEIAANRTPGEVELASACGSKYACGTSTLNQPGVSDLERDAKGTVAPAGLGGRFRGAIETPIQKPIRLTSAVIARLLTDLLVTDCNQSWYSSTHSQMERAQSVPIHSLYGASPYHTPYRNLQFRLAVTEARVESKRRDA